jgi:hypothetical protein
MFSILLMGTLLIAACAGAASEPQASDGEGSAEVSQDSADDDEHMDDADEHMEDFHAALPHEYEGLENPFVNDTAAIAAGAEIFATTCAACHGDSGQGDGPAAAALDPMPASLADGAMMGELSDAYVFWRITEGGINEPFNSAMPPWGEVFTETQRWQLVSFVRTLAQ